MDISLIRPASTRGMKTFAVCGATIRGAAAATIRGAAAAALGHRLMVEAAVAAAVEVVKSFDQ